MELFTIMCVRDRIEAIRWYEIFFGRPPDRTVGLEALWQIGADAWIVVDDRDMRAQRVGGAMVTLAVTDLDDTLARLAAHDIPYGPLDTYGNGVRHVEVLDPDGNSLALAEPPADPNYARK
ncbi:VOC family protein [Nocardia sp. NPDC058058]|uniref:VOC family protein n=1 Tax=Nocardia sp. NPDC058058 TaxID=3346317 RepID=UPI0036D9781C